jgi:hypothetical protein
MKHINSFEIFENKKYDIEDIKSCFVELQDMGFNIEVNIGYLKMVGKNFRDVDKGIEIKVSKDGYRSFLLDDEIVEVLEVAKEYLEESSNVKLDFISKYFINYNGYENKETLDSFENIQKKHISLERIYIYFRPVNTLDKVKNYIKNKLK